MLDGFLHGFGAGAHQNDDAFGVGRADIIEQFIGSTGERGEFVHRLLHDAGEGVEPRVLRFARLEEDVRILRAAAQHRAFRRQGATAQLNDAFGRQHFVQNDVVYRLDLGNLVRGAETVEEMQHRDAPGQRRGSGDSRHVVRFLHRVRGKQRETRGARRHHVGMVAEDRQRMRRDGAGGDVEDGRRQFAGDLVHVRDHQQQALRGREGGRQRAGLQRAMYGAGGAAFGLQFDDFRDAAPDVALALCRPFVGQFAHAGRGGDRVNGDHFGNAEGHVGDGFVTVDGQQVFHDLSLVV